jgi:2-hydroxy-3-keto-5-methylthiopentenyl-1-phosphate phosphatase
MFDNQMEAASSLVGDTAKLCLDLYQWQVYFDFDNTITEFDVLDDIIQRFCVNDDWIVWERDWASGRIGSHECLRGQLKSVRATREALSSYLSEVKVDGDFYRLLAFLRKEGTKPVIVSDSFSFFIKTILDNNGVKGVKVYANGLKITKDRLRPFFPHFEVKCSKCANCKKAHLYDNAGGKKMLYVGDGRSDICPAEHADLVFAKGTLLKYLREKNMPCIEFCNLGDVYRYMKEASRGTKK